MPPRYIPLGQSEVEVVEEKHENPVSRAVGEWSSGICACFDDMQSCKLFSSLESPVHLSISDEKIVLCPVYV